MIKDLKNLWLTNRGLIFRLIVPSLITILLYVVTIFSVIIPSFKNSLIDQKKQMAKELSKTAWGIAYKYYWDYSEGLITNEEAKKQAISRIEFLRYGDDNKDYFWIIDTIPVMIMHPYRKDMVGKNMENYKDKKGTYLFKNAIKIAKESREGYLHYTWQQNDDTSKISAKISFIKAFKPWGWIIGTGMYLEDVKAEVNKLTRWMIDISGLILLIIILMLIFNLRQVIKVSRKGLNTERELKMAKEKYQALAESSNEGTLMMLEDNTLYANNNMLNLIGYREESIQKMSVFDIISQDQINAYLGERYLKLLMSGIASPRQFEARLRRSDGTYVKAFLSCSRLNLMGKNAVVIAAKDVVLENVIQKKLGLDRGKYRDLFNVINVGVFRTTMGQKAKIIDVNPASIGILGFEDEKDAFDYDFFEMFQLDNERKEFMHQLFLAGFCRDKEIRITRIDQKPAVVSLTCVLVNDKENNAVYLDGIIEDKTSERKKKSEMETLIVELHSSSFFMNIPLSKISQEVVACNDRSTIRKVVETMIQFDRNAVLISNQEGHYYGIISDHDLKKKVLANELSIDSVAAEIMSSPLITINEYDTVYEALIKMRELNVGHLGIRESSGKVIGMINTVDIINMQNNTSSYLIREIRSALKVEQLANTHEKVQYLVKSLIDGGANPEFITREITTISDAVVFRLSELATEQIGRPPINYCFVSLGSEGREEQSLLTDQDNAIIFANVPDDQLDTIKDYFLKFGSFICDGLDVAGYNYCKGNYMAMNPVWCQPISEWKNYFKNWITKSKAEDLLDVTIFFDMRPVSGDFSLAKETMEYAFELIHEKGAILLSQMKDGLNFFKPPINAFGRIILDSTDRHAEGFDVKKVMMPVIGFARIYALQNSMYETNTLIRLQKLNENGKLATVVAAQAEQAYNFLMMLRLRNQANQISNNSTPDNFVNPKVLTEIEQTILKKVFGAINNLQSKMNQDFEE